MLEFIKKSRAFMSIITIIFFGGLFAGIIDAAGTNGAFFIFLIVALAASCFGAGYLFRGILCDLAQKKDEACKH